MTTKKPLSSHWLLFTLLLGSSVATQAAAYHHSVDYRTTAHKVASSAYGPLLREQENRHFIAKKGHKNRHHRAKSREHKHRRHHQPKRHQNNPASHYRHHPVNDRRHQPDHRLHIRLPLPWLFLY